MGEDLPEECNEVLLDPALTHAHGIPAPPLVRYRLSDNSLRDARTRRGSRERGAARRRGDRVVWAENPRRQSGWHLLGTCPAWASPRRGRWSTAGAAAHDAPNLFLVDGSTMVTSAGVNPTSTLQAIALYIADGMIRRRG